MKIPLKIQQLNPDRTNYKVWGLLIQPVDTYVLVDVPDEYVTESPTDDFSNVDYILTEDGLKWLMTWQADFVNKVESEYLKLIQKRQ